MVDLVPAGVRILGPVSATVGGHEVSLGSPKQRAVFAALAMSSGQVVSTDRLVDELWGDDAPESALSTLQVYVSRLRKSLVDDVPGSDGARPQIVRRAPGYVLEVPDDAVDARRFARLLADARAGLADDPGAALRSLDAALALVSGPPLADVVDSLGDAAAAEASRLEELVLLAQEARLTALLSLGDASAVVGAASALVEQHPFRESLHALLVLALYRDERQAEALAAYDQVRRRLDDELGVEPGRSLRRLHAQVLDQDPALDLPRSGPRPAPRGDLDGGRHHNLTGSVTPLIGRTGELRLLAERLDAQRLVTIVGTGGMGKTRLALEAARARRDADGPWFVDLAGLADGSLLVEAVATALAIGGAQDAAALATTLRERQVVLVLDNCEQIADDVAQLATTLLETCPGVRVLATSRQTLGAPGELVLDLRPLPSGQAEQLFLERASVLLPGWHPDASEREALARLCRGLDDLPLAIELAAAQCRALSVEQLADQLGDRFALLSGGRRGNQRHASMTAAIAWSYDTLSADERAMFEVFSVFEGSFDLEGATAIAGGRSVLATLLSLVDKSLVSVLEGTPRRYRILETLRQYAALQRSDETTQRVREAVVEWAAAVAERADVELRGPASREWMHRLDQDKDTIRAALAWPVGDPEVHLRIAVGMVWFWYRRGHIVEGLRALEPLSAAQDPALLLRGSVGRVLLSYLAGDYATLVHELGTASGLAAESQDEAAKSYALSTVAFFEANLGQIDQALRDSGVALELARSIDSPQRAADALLAMSTGYLRAGDLVESRRHSAAAVTEADACGYAWCAVASLWIGSKARITDGDFSDETQAGLARVIGDSLADRDVTSWLVGVVSAAYVLLRRGHSGHAAELAGIAHRQGQLVGFAPERMDPVETLAYLGEITGRITAEDLTARYDEGHALDTDEAFARVAVLVHG